MDNKEKINQLKIELFDIGIAMDHMNNARTRKLQELAKLLDDKKPA